MHRRSLKACVVALICVAPATLYARGATFIIAKKGEPVAVADGWPEGVGAIVNDPARATGWRDTFSQWPNDVDQYGFEIKTIDDLNRLIEKLAATKSAVRQIRLSHLKEPAALGWVTNLPTGNNNSVIFSIGNQTRINEWYAHVRKPFGAMEFTAAPIAVPPTLTIFVQNEAVDLDELKIPMGITVTSGYLPSVFHRFNTTLEKKQEEETARKPKAETGEVKDKLDPASKVAAETIEAFLKRRNPSK